MTIYRWMLFFLFLLSACQTTEESKKGGEPSNARPLELASIDFSKEQLLTLADQYLGQAPVPITQFFCERSAGGRHDFYSEGDYWWPNPEDPDGPYIRKDGKTNPENFVSHRKAMRNLNEWVSSLVAAYKITGDEKYANHALRHLRAFFLDPATLMNPNLLYAQAIKGRVTGRGIGLIDTIHFIEVAKAIEELVSLGFLKEAEENALKAWFEEFLIWMNTHPYGLAEKVHGNNHSTWWAAQVATFAHLTERTDYLDTARQQLPKLLAIQMAKDGSFPEELERTKPYNYTLFNLEGYAVLCQIASSKEFDLWHYEGPNGSLGKAWQFMKPYLVDKSSWIKAPDVQHFDELPIQSPGMLFAALAYKDQELFDTWQELSPERKSEEINRTYPISQFLLWVD